jgi:hypothetical protein
MEHDRRMKSSFSYRKSPDEGQKLFTHIRADGTQQCFKLFKDQPSGGTLVFANPDRSDAPADDSYTLTSTSGIPIPLHGNFWIIFWTDGYQLWYRGAPILRILNQRQQSLMFSKRNMRCVGFKPPAPQGAGVAPAPAALIQQEEEPDGELPLPEDDDDEAV